MIVSFGDKATEDLYHGRSTARTRHLPADITAVALRKLDMLNAAKMLMDLRSPPGNRLEALRGDLKELHGIRINGQWRVVFRWIGSDAHEVRVVDYH